MKKFAWAVLISISCCRLWAATLYVDLNNAAPVAPYDSWATAATNIQDAINAASPGDTIRIADGHYLLSSQISVTKAITIQSVNGPESTIVDGQGSVRCFNLANSACVIEGLTITNGYTTGYGGGIYCSGTTPVVTNCTITGNSANWGGGGMDSGTANNCTISGNSALYGGGMYDGTANNCTISGNSASDGGGMYRGWAANCFVSGNSASSGGGGMNGGTANNCTITENSAQIGGGMRNGTANNCIVWFNEATTSKNLYSTTARFTCSPDVAHGVDGNITNAPMLLSSSHIATNSPCRGTGSALYASGTDIDGEAWLNPPSMGCDEYHGSVAGELQVAIECSASVVDMYTLPIQGLIEGALNRHVWDFGDGTLITNSHLVTHAWSSPGTYELTLTAYNDTYPSGVSATQAIHVVSAESTAVHVSVSGNDADDGSSWALAKATIQAGVDAQQYYGGNVWISNGTYAVTNEILVNKTVLVRSVTGPETTLVDGQGVVRCFNLGNSACVIEGLTITNGYTSGNGGGIYCSGATPVVTNCIISGNSTSKSGGGIYNGTAINCIISGNSAEYGGGGMCYGTANNCSISGNFASNWGGGMYYGTANNCTITANSAQYGGGMLDSTVKNCTISENSAYLGGGMYSGTAKNCIISGNSATAAGGMYEGTANNCSITGNSAIELGGGTMFSTANNCTINENSAGIYGVGGMYEGTANSCIVWFNVASSEENLSTTTVRFTCSPDVTHGVDGNITNAPGFIDAANGDFRLMSNSSCINWGNNSYASGTLDLDGQPRIVGDYVDMGAYEYQGAMVPDQNGDGIPDEWKRTWFGYNVDPAGNPDGDAFSNLDEYIAGTDPTDPASYFAVTNALPSASGFVVEWPAVEGREYTVLWTPELTNATHVLQDGLAYPQSSYTDTVHAAESAGFYQVEVRMQ